MESNFEEADGDLLEYEEEPLYHKQALGLKDSNLGTTSHRDSQIAGMGVKDMPLAQTPERTFDFKQWERWKNCHL